MAFPTKVPLAFANLPVPLVIVWVSSTVDVPSGLGMDVPVNVVINVSPLSA